MTTLVNLPLVDLGELRLARLYQYIDRPNQRYYNCVGKKLAGNRNPAVCHTFELLYINLRMALRKAISDG